MPIAAASCIHHERGCMDEDQGTCWMKGRPRPNCCSSSSGSGSSTVDPGSGGGGTEQQRRQQVSLHLVLDVDAGSLTVYRNDALLGQLLLPKLLQDDDRPIHLDVQQQRRRAGTAAEAEAEAALLQRESRSRGGDGWVWVVELSEAGQSVRVQCREPRLSPLPMLHAPPPLI